MCKNSPLDARRLQIETLWWEINASQWSQWSSLLSSDSSAEVFPGKNGRWHTWKWKWFSHSDQLRWVTLVGEKRQLIKHYQGNLSGSIKSTSEPDYQLHYVTTTWWGAQTWAGPYCIYTDMMRRWQTSVSAGQRGNTYAAWRAQGRASPVSTWGRRKDETGETEGEKKPWTVTM